MIVKNLTVFYFSQKIEWLECLIYLSNKTITKTNNKSESPMSEPKPTGSLFLYDVSTDGLVRVDDQYIEGVEVLTVQRILDHIRSSVRDFESDPYKDEEELINDVKTFDDVVIKCVGVYRWRRGFGFVFLQISHKNDGSARLSVFTTNTVHHSAASFGTVPSASEAKSLLQQHVGDPAKLIADLKVLKQSHVTKVSAIDLAKNIQC